jgi:hypothetical protein
MAGKKMSGSKNPARKKKVPIKDLSSPSQELSEGQAKAVKEANRFAVDQSNN